MTVRRIVVSLTIVACVAAAGYAAWTIRRPISLAFQALTSFRSQDSFSFVVVGDNHGVNDVYRQILKEIKGGQYAFLLNVADTSEFGQRQEFESVHALESALPFPTFHVFGNHDIKTDATGGIFADVFGNKPCASLTSHGWRIVLLNNADRKVGFPTDCLDMFEADLDAHPDQPTVVAYHRPFNLPLAALVGDDETRASRATNDRFLQILKTHHNIKYVFTGHIHTYLPYTIEGIPGVVSGGGGDPAQTILGGSKNNYFHYLVVQVRGRSITTDVRRVQLEE